MRHGLPSAETAYLRSTILTAPDTWLKVCGAPVNLAPQWRVEAPEYLMSKEVAPVDLAPPSPYAIEVVGGDAVIRAATGEQAARGRIAVWGSAAIVDQVETDPEHRRRGLGRVVMARLEVIAAELGATRLVLVATEDGRGLYRSLGWNVERPVTAAPLPDP